MIGEQHRGEIAEHVVAEAFREQGLIVLQRGWPDMLIVGDDHTLALEVKIGARAALTTHQRQMHQALNAAGLPTTTIHHYGRQASLLPSEAEMILRISEDLK